MDSTIIIKVKYGKTLRRFSAEKLELCVLGLREKILSLFKLSREVDLTLTYLDEDGDSVTLVDDEDIDDVVWQSLNPVRISAKVNAEISHSSSLRSIASEVPAPITSSPCASKPLPNLNDSVSEASRAALDPIWVDLTKLYLDSKIATSSPNERILHFSKLLQSYSVTTPDSQSTGSESVIHSSKGKEPEASKAGVAYPKVVYSHTNKFKQRGTFTPTIAPAPAPIPESLCINPYAFHLSHHEKEQVKKFGGSSFNTGGANPAWENIYAHLHRDGKEEVKNFSGSSFNAGGVKPAWENIKVLGNNDKQVKKQDASLAAPFYFENQNTVPNTVGFGGNKSSGVNTTNFAGKYPYSGTPVANEAAVPYTHCGPRVHPFKKSYNQGGVAGLIHRGVGCDGCGISPITGPRYKSKVKTNYDLCSMCFAESGSEADYLRMDRPIPYRHPPHCDSLYDFNPRVNTGPAFPKSFRALGKPTRPKLDSRFVADVNVVDGTLMAPSTPFTKIWRMRNNGTLVWPQGTQLVWIGGDRLGDSISAGLQIAVEGLDVETELEVSVDFTAPEIPGRYVSYWRMASPAGQKFGQRIWVLIQVDRQALNLNLPPESNGLVLDENQAIKFEPIVVSSRLPVPELYSMATSVEPLVLPPSTKDQNVGLPINDNLLATGTKTPSLGPAAVSYPSLISSAVPYVVTSMSSAPTPLSPLVPPVSSPSEVPYSPATASPVPPYILPSLVTSPPRPLVAESLAQESGEEEDAVEEILLKELEEMGFKQVDLNKEILRTNEYNLEKSVDDLCGVSEWEWDPILEELQEMGFCDNEVNKMLLRKNNGSVKGVVMDLITGDKA